MSHPHSPPRRVRQASPTPRALSQFLRTETGPSGTHSPKLQRWRCCLQAQRAPQSCQTDAVDSEYLTNKSRRQSRPKSVTLTSVWLETALSVKIAVIALLALGVLLTALGVAADLSSVWGDLPFSVNMVSGVASACFGIPVALVVLPYLLFLQQERTIRQKTHAAVSEFRRLVDDYVRDEARYEEIGNLIQRVRKSFGGNSRNETKELLSLVLKSWYEAVPASHERPGLEAHISEQWKYLDSVIQPLIHQAGLPWLDPSTARLGSAIKWGQSPLNNADRAIESLKRQLQEGENFMDFVFLETAHEDIGKRREVARKISDQLTWL